jgi:hypothetical protein
MALMRGKLLAGALFAGALFGTAQDVVAPEQPIVTGYGGYVAHRKVQSYVSPVVEARKQDRIVINDDDEVAEILVAMLGEIL